MMYGAYATSRHLAVSRIFLRFLSYTLFSVFICFLYVYVTPTLLYYFFFFLFSVHIFSFLCYKWNSLVLFSFYNFRKALEDKSNNNNTSVVYKLYVIVLSIYAGAKFCLSFLLHIPACHRLSDRCDSWPLVRWMKWMHQVYILYCAFA